MPPLYRSWALCIDEEQGLLGFPVWVSLGLDKLLLAATRLDATKPGLVINQKKAVECPWPE